MTSFDFFGLHGPELSLQIKFIRNELKYMKFVSSDYFVCPQQIISWHGFQALTKLANTASHAL